MTVRVVRDSVRALIRSRYQHGTVETSRVDRHGAERYLLRTQWGIVSNGMLHRIWGSTRDITELKNAQLALANAERRWTDILEAVHHFAIVLADDESVSFCNDYLVKSSGVARGRDRWQELVRVDDPRRRARRGCERRFGFTGSQSDSAGCCEATLVRRDGRKAPD